MNFVTIVLYFFIYSVIGWCAEMIYCRIGSGKWVNRGFLFGPYCPIYGFGAILIVTILHPFCNRPIFIFLLGMLLTTILEYLTSLIMEKAFHAKWWDYSQMRFNIHGRVCLLNSLEFGMLGIVLTYFIHPQITHLLTFIPATYLSLIAYFVITILMIDFVATLSMILHLKEKLNILKEIAESMKEKSINTIKNKEILLQLKEIKLNLAEKNSAFNKRLIEAFPSLEFDKLGHQLDEIRIIIHQKQTIKKEKRHNYHYKSGTSI